MDALQRRLPQSLDAEQAVLGSILIENSCFEDVAQIISADDFYLEVHSQIFALMQSYNLQNKPIDVIPFLNSLVSEKIYEDMDAARSYVKLLVDIVPSYSNAADYAKIVRDKSTLRRLIQATDEIQSDAYSSGEDVTKIVDAAEKRIYEISDKNIKRDFVHIREVIVQTVGNLQTLQAEGGKADTGVPTGYEDLDNYVVGFGKGNLVIVGARPGIGKTSFCLNLATNIAKSSKKAVCIFSLEMTNDELVKRIISSESRVHSEKIRTGQLDTSDWEKIANACSGLSETDIYIDDTSSITLTAMKAKLRRIKNLGLVVVDYLQLMESEIKRKDASKATEVGDISRGLKLLAKELGVPVIVCSQLSRSSEKEKERKPMLSDLRDSGAIEQDADMVIFLSRDFYGNDPEKANLVTVSVAKNRHGSSGSVEMSWLGQYYKFSTLENHLIEE